MLKQVIISDIMKYEVYHCCNLLYKSHYIKKSVKYSYTGLYSDTYIDYSVTAWVGKIIFWLIMTSLETFEVMVKHVSSLETHDQKLVSSWIHKNYFFVPQAILLFMIRDP